MSKRPHTLTALALASVVLAAPAGASAADTIRLTHYELTFEARIDHQHVTNFSSSDASSHTQLDDTTNLFGRMDVTFADGRLQPTDQGNARGFTTAEYTAGASDVGSSGTEHCTATPGLPRDWGAPSISEPELTPLGDPQINLRLSEASNVVWDSCSGNLGPAAFPDLSDASKELGEGPLDAVFTMPTEAIGNGKIIQLISGPPAGSASFCPGNENATTTSCTYGWSGTVTLTKLSETTISDGNTPAGQPAARPVPAARSAAKPAGPKKPTASTSAKAGADAKGKTITFDADCPLGCAGIAHLNFGSGRGKASAAAGKGVAIRFSVKAGKRRTVELTVPASARRKLRRARGATLKITLTPKGGKPVSRTLAVKVAKRR